MTSEPFPSIHVLDGIRHLPVPYVFASASIIFSLSLFALLRRLKASTADVPFHGHIPNNPGAQKKKFIKGSLNLLSEGYNKFHGAVFQVLTNEGNQLVIPPRFVEEMKALPEEVLGQELNNFLQCEHTGAFTHDEFDRLWYKIVLQDVTKQGAILVPELKEELDYGVSVEFPSCDDWTPIQIHPKVISCMAFVTGRLFVGQTLARDLDWHKLSIVYTIHAFVSAMAVRSFHPRLRPIVKYFLPPVRQVWQDFSDAAQMLASVIKQRLSNEKEPGWDDRGKPNDSLQWILDSLPNHAKEDYAYHARSQLGLTAVALHNTANLAVYVLHELAARPEDREMLRQEVKDVIEGKFDGRFTIDALNELRKMDSYIKEVQRSGNAIIGSWFRRAGKSHKLSDGTIIPRGVTMFAPAVAISADPEIYDCPDEFDGLRFYKMGQRSVADKNKYQLVSTSSTMMHFGLGRHACPGRFVAATEIKLTLATLLTQYDFKFKKDAPRPVPIQHELSNSPDPKVELLFKRRDVNA